MKRIISLSLSIVMIFTTVLCVNISAYAKNKLLVDDASLLTKKQSDYLEEMQNRYSNNLSFDIVIVTKNNIGEKSPQDYADDYYDYNGYGQNQSHDGCLFLVDMGGRYCYISTTGYGITALTDYGINYILNQTVSDLSSGKYYDSFYKYIELVNEFVKHAKQYSPYDTNNTASFVPVVYNIDEDTSNDCNKLGHNYVTTIKRATPTQSGYVSRVCSRCGDEHYKYLEKINVKLSDDVFFYNGKVRKPKVIANYSSECYKVTYPKGMKKPGKYTVTIVFNDKYHYGTIKKTFAITKKIAKVTGVSSVITSNNKKKKVTYVAKWKKVKGASGYQIRFGGKDEGGKYWTGTKNIKGASKTNYKTNCTYGTSEAFDCYAFVKVRAYKIVNGKKVYGSWSKIAHSKNKNI